MKKNIIRYTAAAAGLLAAVLLVLLLVGNRNGKAEIPDPDSRYPYSVRRTKQGLLLTVTGGEAGCQWRISSDDPRAAAVTVQSRSEQKTELLVCPGEAGTAAVAVTLENLSAPYDAAYRLTLLVSTAEDGVTLLNAAHREYPEAIRDAEGRYSVSAKADGGYLVCLTGGDWAAMMKSGSADVKPCHPEWVSPEAEESCFSVSDNGADEAVIAFAERTEGAVLELTFSRSPSGVLLPVSHVLRTTEEAPDDKAEGAGWNLPEGAVLLETGTEERYSQENGKALCADSVWFFMDGETWKLLRAAGESRRALAIRDFRMCDEMPDGEDAAAAETEKPLWVFRVDEAWCCAWELGDTAYLLMSPEADRAALEAAADTLMEQKP